MFPQEKNDKQVHVVFVLEGTAAMGQFYKQLRNGYIIPTLQYFNGGPLIESSYSGQYGNKVFSLVVYNSIDYMPSQTVFCHCPTSNAWEVLRSMDEIRFVGGGGESKSLLGEGLASAMQIFDDIEAIAENGPTPMVQHCIVITSSPPFMTPSFHGSRYSGYTVEELAALVSERNINLSVISPRKLYELQQLYDKACGELQVLSTKEYAIDQRHLILLRGYELQERPQTAIEPSSVKQDQPLPHKLPAVSAPHSSTITHSSAAPNVVVSSSSMVFKNANQTTNINNLKVARSILQSQQQPVPMQIPGSTITTNINMKGALSAGTIQLDDKHNPMSSLSSQVPPNQTVSQAQGGITQHQQTVGMAQQPVGLAHQHTGGMVQRQPGGMAQQQPGGMAQQQPGGMPQQQPGGMAQKAGGIAQQQPGGMAQHQPGGMAQQPGGMTQQQVGITQQPGGMAQQQPGGMAQQQPGGMAQQQPGSMAQQPGGMAQQPGGMAQQPGGMAQQPGGMAQQQPGGMAQQPGGMAQQPGGMAQQPGSMVQQQSGGIAQIQQQGIRQPQMVPDLQQQQLSQSGAGIQAGIQPQPRMQIQAGMQGIARMQGLQQQQGLTPQQSRLLQQQLANIQQSKQQAVQQGRVQSQPTAMGAGQGQAGMQVQQAFQGPAGMTGQQTVNQQQLMTSRPGQQAIAPGPAINTIQRKQGLTKDQLMELFQKLPKEKRDIFIAEMKKKSEGNAQAGGAVASSAAVGMQQLKAISTMNQMTLNQNIGMGATTSQSIITPASTSQQIPPAAISAARDVLKKARQTTANPRMATPGGQSFNPGQPQMSNPLLNMHGQQQLQQNLPLQQQNIQQQQPIPQQQQQPGILNQGQQLLHQAPMSSGSTVVYQQNQTGGVTTIVNQPGNTVANRAGRPIKVLWSGMLEWHERPRQGTTLETQQRITHCINCQVSADTETNINCSAWPKKLTMQLIPYKFLHSMGALVKNSHIVNFDFPDQGADTEARNVLLRVLQNQFAGCIHLSSEVQSNTRVLLLWYVRPSNQFKGRIPKDQAGFINSFRELIKKHQQDQKQLQQQAMGGNRPQMHGAGPSMVQRPGNLPQVVGQRAMAPQTVVSSNNQKNIQDIMQKLNEGHTLNADQQQQLQQQLQQSQQQQAQPNQQMMQRTQPMQQINIRPNQVINQQPGMPTQTQQLPSNSAQLKDLLLREAQSQPGQMQWNPNQQQLGQQQQQQQQQQNLLLQQQQLQQAMGGQRMPQRAMMQQQPGMMGQRAMLQPGMNPMQGMGGKPMARQQQQQQQQQQQKGGLSNDVSLMDLLQPETVQNNRLL